MLLESPSAIALTTPNSAVAFAGEHLHLTAQHDAQLAAGATFAAANGDAVSLYTADGGLKAIANHGPVDVPPDLSSAPVSSSIPHEKEIGREEAFF